MKLGATILSFVVLLLFPTIKSVSQLPTEMLQVEYFGDTLHISNSIDIQIPLQHPANETAVKQFCASLNTLNFTLITQALTIYKENKQLDDWLFYQLIRRTAQQLSPKNLDYERYTLYKWVLLAKCGYNAQLAFAHDKLLLYVQSDENIYDIPLFIKDRKQFVCLNIHDFGRIDFQKTPLYQVKIDVPGAMNSFSYRVKKIPDFKAGKYNEKKLVFNYEDIEYRYNVKLDPQMAKIFANYPSVDFESYFNIPLSSVTYASLIPLLKKKLKGMKQKAGIDYLMNFTRHAFMYENDIENFGAEKRLSPEQTLMNDFSDCDDRVALFYYLVKEMYNLPMIVMVYPSHVTLAIEFKNPVGTPVMYNGRKFSVCEPTPQKIELPIGRLMPELKDVAYQVVYEYIPVQR